MIKIKTIIEQFSEKHIKLNKKVHLLKEAFVDEERLWSLLEKIDEDFFYNSEGFGFLADSLQLVDDKKRWATYELSDIEQMYRLLVKYYPDNLQYHIDLINFVYRVLDNKKEAICLINELEKYLNKQRENISELLKQISDE